MNFFNFVIKRKTLISMLFLGLTILGIISYRQLPVELLPNTELPFLIVQLSSGRAANPEIVEKEAIVPLEGRIGTLDNIDKVESYVDRRGGQIIVYYNKDCNLKHAYLHLQQEVQAAKSLLSSDYIVQVMRIDLQQISNRFMMLQVRGSGGSNYLREISEQEIVTKLREVDGIANVEVFGGRKRTVEILLDDAACEALNISRNQIRQALAGNKELKEAVGNVYENGQQLQVNVVAEYTRLEQLENLIVKSDGPVYLKDVAKISFDYEKETSHSRVNGKDAITIQLTRENQINLLKISADTRKEVELLNKKLKSRNIEIVIQNDSAEIIERNIDLIINLALTGGLLALLILWFFLRRLPLIAIIAFSIPTSVYIAFNFFYAYEISLNSLTLVGIALAVGMLLDNSIVVLENIYRLLQKGLSAEAAVARGTSEVWRSVTASTLTTIIVFLPFVFSNNLFIRVLGRHIGVSIVSTLIISLFVSLVFVPMAAHFVITRFGKLSIPTFSDYSYNATFFRKYRVLLKSFLRAPVWIILAALFIFFSSLLISLLLSLNTSEEVNLDRLTVYLTMPTGATLESTDQTVGRIEALLDDLPEKQDVIAQVYEDEATIDIRLKEDFEKLNNLKIEDVKTEINRRLNDLDVGETGFEPSGSSNRFRGGGANAEADMGMNQMLGIGNSQEQILVKGQNFADIRKIAGELQFHLEDISSIDRVSIDLPGDRPELHINFDNRILSNYNIPREAIAGELSAFGSQISSGIKFRQDNIDYDIQIKTGDQEKDQTIDDLKSTVVSASGDKLMALSELGDFVFSSGISRIKRVNQIKQVTVTYRFRQEVKDSKAMLNAARGEVDAVLAQMKLPGGVAVELQRENKQLTEFYFLITVAIILIYMILAMVFESLLSPIIIMFTIPLAATGSLWAITITGNSLLNANSLTGFLILLGVVVNNGIIFLDYTRILRGRGFTKNRALIMAGQARLRPIFITALTTIIALLPLAMGKVEYVTSVGAPFAITVIGGLGLSTLFTLLFIPTVYSGMDSLLDWFKKLNWKLQAVQIITLAASFGYIWLAVDSIVWRLIFVTLVTFIVPGLTFFILNSLRSAKADLIPADERLHIEIQNLVKIYDQGGRFIREWQRVRGVLEKTAPGRLVLNQQLLWQTTLFCFLIYFVYFYIFGNFWFWVNGILFYQFGVYYLRTRFDEWFGKENGKIYRAIAKIPQLFYWLLPAGNMYLFWERGGKTVLTILLVVIWYFFITVYYTARKLDREKTDIYRLTGKFRKIRRFYFRMVLNIPILGKRKKPFEALAGISLQIGEGMFGLLGPNGAGKTTLMRIICGILDQSYGIININGFDTREKREELQGLIGYLPQEFGSYENMTADEYLNYLAILKGLKQPKQRAERINYVISAVHMEEHRHSKIGAYSGGMKQRIGIAQTLLHLPRILVVDEPTAGLDPRERIRFRNLLVELSRDRIVIFSTHIIEDVASSCNKLAVISRGKLKYMGEPVSLAAEAKNKVWQIEIAEADFEQVAKSLKIVQHIKVGGKIRLRCLAAQKPHAQARPAVATLEDAYLWLIGNENNGNIFEEETI